MKKCSVFALVVSLLTGCGYDSDQPAYDTADNPHGFPKTAVLLLDNIENDRLATFEEISEAFGVLYTSNSELLDDNDWKVVIDRLGLRLYKKAELARSLGLPGYRLAAGYYVLASFARPQDQEMMEMGRLFGCWLKTLQDSSLATEVELFLTDSESAPLSVTRRLGLMRRFVLADSINQEFAEAHLLPELFGLSKTSISDQELLGLASVDIALAGYLGLTEHIPDRKLASFGQPTVDLVAARISPTAPNTHLAELYFLPHKRISADYEIALRIHTVDSLTESPSRSLRFVPFDFKPTEPTSMWKEGEIAVAYRTIRFLGPTNDISVGLMDKSITPTRYLEPVDEETKLCRILLDKNSHE